MELLHLCTLCAILIVSSLFLLRLLVFAGGRRNLPPGPRPLPLIGNLLDLDSQVHRSLARLAARHGPLMTLRLGAVTTIVVSSADAARDVLQRHDATFSVRSVPDAVRACAHDQHSMGWLPPGSPIWRALRKVCSAELFAKHRLDAHQSLRRDKVQRLVDHVEHLARDGAPVDLARLVFTTVLNLLSCTIFSIDLAHLDDQGTSGNLKGLVVEFSMLAGVPNVSDLFPAVAPLDPQRLRTRLSRGFKRFHAIFDEQIERRLQERAAGEPPKNDFLDLLLDYRGTADGLGFVRQTLHSLFMDLFTAGTDTSTATVEWAMAELLQSPSSMAKVRAELAQVMGSKQIEESDIEQLPYLQAVVKETFRLHPGVPLMLPHQAKTTTEIRGYTVPKGARVIVNAWAICRDPEAWAEPDKFMPERFLEKEIDFRGKDFEFLPFGAGRRMCPGMSLAARMVHLILGTLLHRFEWKLPADVEKNGVDMTEQFGVTVSLVTPLRVIAKRV